MAGIAAEACEMFGIRSEIGGSRIDHPAGPLHQPAQARMPAGLVRSFEHQPQPLLDQFPETAAAACRLCFGPAMKIIWYFER
jgi:hypothetical protein